MPLRRLALTVALLVASAASARAGDTDPPPAAADAPKLIESLAGGDVAARRKAAYALWKIGGDAPSAAIPLARAMLDGDAYVRTTAAKALAKHVASLADAGDVLGEVLTKGAPDVRIDAAKFLYQFGVNQMPVAALVGALADASPEVRANAAAALGRTGQAGREAAPALLERVTDDEDERVRLWAAQALGAIDGARLVEPMLALYRAGDAAERVRAIKTLGYGGAAAASASRVVARALEDADADLRAAAAATLGQIGPAAEINRLLAALDDTAPTVRAAALAALNFPGPGMKPALPRLVPLLDAPDAAVRAGAATAIASIDPSSADAKLAALLREDPDASVRQAAAYGLRNLGARLPDSALAALAKALDDADVAVRQIAGSALLQLGPQAAPAAPALIRVASAADADPFVRQWAVMALPKVGVDAKTAVPILTEALRASAPMVRMAAANTLGGWGETAASASASLADAVLHDDDANARSAAAMALASIGPSAKEAAAALVEVPDDAPYLVRVHAAYALARTAPDDAAKPVAALVALIGADRFFGLVPVMDLGLIGAPAKPAEARLLELLRDGDRRPWSAAAQALCRIGGDGAKEALNALLAAVSAPDTKEAPDANDRRRSALRALGELRPQADRSVPVIAAALASKDSAARYAAALALAALGPSAAAALPALERATRDDDSSVRAAAEAALVQVRARDESIR